MSKTRLWLLKHAHLKIISAVGLLVATVILYSVVYERQNLLTQALSVVSFEAESGTKSGSYSVISETAASGGQAVALGVPTAAPTATPTPSGPQNPLAIEKTALDNHMDTRLIFAYTINITHATATNYVDITVTDQLDPRLNLNIAHAVAGPNASTCTMDASRLITCHTKVKKGEVSKVFVDVIPNSTAKVGDTIANSATVRDGAGNVKTSAPFNTVIVGPTTAPPTATIAPTPTTAPNTVNMPVRLTITNPSTAWDAVIYFWNWNYAPPGGSPGTPVTCQRVNAGVATINAVCYNVPRSEGINYVSFGAYGIRKSDNVRSIPASEAYSLIPLTGAPNPASVSVSLTLTAPTIPNYHRIFKSSSVGSAPRGQQYNYTLSVYDEYNITPQTVTITDQIDQRLTVRGASITNGTCSVSATKLVTCTGRIKWWSPLTVNIGVTLNTTATPCSIIYNAARVTGGGFTKDSDSVPVGMTGC